MIYTVFSTEDSPYQNWQAELLEYSWKRAGQEGELVRLVATDGRGDLPRHRYAQSVATQTWATHPNTGDWYPIYNKPASLLEWLYRDRPFGTVLLVDPDCVFRAPINREVEEGHPAAQKWIRFALDADDSPFGLDDRFAFLSRYCVNTEPRAQGVMIPTLIHTNDLRRMIGRWLELCGVIRDQARDDQGERIWESDMFAYIAAAAEYGLVHEPANLGICTNWAAESVPDAPMVHYCNPILSRDGDEMLAKGSYRPWTRIDDPSRAESDHGRDMLALLNDYIDSRTRTPSRLSRRPKRRERFREGIVGAEMVLLAPGESEQAVWLNQSGRDIWELSDGTRTVDDILDDLQQRYGSSRRELHDDVVAAIDHLQDLCVLEFEES